MKHKTNIQYEALDKATIELNEIREVREHIDQREIELKETIKNLLVEMETESYKNNYGVLSFKTTKKYEYDEEKVMEYLKENNIVLYLDTDPRIKKNFDKDLRAGKLQGGWPDGIELKVDETKSVAYRPIIEK